MSVRARLADGDEAWELEPAEPRPEELVLGWLRADQERDAAGRQTCVFAVVDDVHHLRVPAAGRGGGGGGGGGAPHFSHISQFNSFEVLEVMGRYNASKASAASVWMRRRELRFLSAANAVLTVSEEDAHTFRAALAQSSALQSSALQSSAEGFGGERMTKRSCEACGCNKV